MCDSYASQERDIVSRTGKCRGCEVTFTRPRTDPTPDDFCVRCWEEVQALRGLSGDSVAWPEERIDVIGQNGPDGRAYTPGIKHDGEKPQLDLLMADMPHAAEAIGQVLTAGAQKYAPANWKQVAGAQRRYLAAGMRHELALAKGQEEDPETNVHHLAHVACCVLFRLELALQEQAK